MLAGCQLLKFDGQTSRMSKGHVCVLEPGTVHTSWTETEGFSEIVIHVLGLSLSTGLHQVSDEALARINADATLEGVRALIDCLGPPIPPRPRQIAQVIVAVENSLDTPWTVERMARISAWSPSHFSHQFKASLGTSPRLWLRRQRVHRAAWLLENTDYSATDIAFQVGFSSPSRLSDAFRAVMDKTPSQWRTAVRSVRERDPV